MQTHGQIKHTITKQNRHIGQNKRNKHTRKTNAQAQQTNTQYTKHKQKQQQIKITRTH